MCSADAPRPRRQAGYTFIEMAITVFILSGLSVMSAQSFSGVRDSTDTLASLRRAQHGTEELSYQIHGLVTSARKLYVRGTVGTGYLDALDFEDRRPSPGVRLPLPDELSPLGRDEADVPRTGNMLLLAAESDPVTCPADPATGAVRYVDIYRMIAVYPRESSRRVVVARPEKGLDLRIWASVPFPSHVQLLGIASPVERARVVAALRTVYGCRYAWNPDKPVAEAFFALDATGTMSAIPDAVPPIPEDDAVSPGGRLLYRQLQLARTEAASVQRKALLTSDAPEDWVPNGFEVKMVGTPNQRRVWFRLVVEAQNVTGRAVAYDTELIATLRDL
jgi:hypothetical protein